MLGRHLGHFRILDRIGEGGMGIVYKAEDENLRRPVALKVLRPRFLEDEAQHQRLIREAQSAAAFNHPNIAAIYEIGQADGLAFIAMEYVDGKPLRSVLQGHLPPASDVLQYAVEIARGLACAHDAGIVHRDLKPENFLVDADGHIKVLDFGLAKPANEISEETPTRSAVCEAPPPFATEDGQILGTPFYMSPEQADGRSVDTRSDIYSFGVVLHELLTGKTPKRGEKQVHSSGNAANDTSPASAVRAELIAIAQRCLSPDKEDRFADGRALLAVLEAAEKQKAAPPVKSSRSQLRREYVLGVAGAVLGCVAVLWIAASFLPKATASAKTFRSSLAPARRLTAGPSANMISDAVISPDGQKFAFADPTGLYISKIDSAERRRVDLPKDLLPRGICWFPDNESLFIAALEVGKVHHSIWRIDPRHGAQRLSNPLFRWVPRLSPDGKAYTWVDDTKGIYWARLDDQLPQLVVPSAEGDIFLNPTWSPDNKRIAYVRLREAKKGPQPFIETVDLAGSPPRIVVQRQDLLQDQGDVPLGWMPDGRLIYGVAEVPPKEPGTTLWTVPVHLSTGEPAREPTALWSWTGPIDGALSVSGNGRVVFQRSIGQLEIYAADLLDQGKQLGSKRRLTSTPRDERPTDWSPDGQSIAFMSNENGSQQIFLLNADTSESRLVTKGPSWHTWPRFTPEGLLLFWHLPPAPNEEPSQMELMRLGANEDAPTRVFAAGLPVRFKRNGRPPPRNVQFRCPRAGTCVFSELVWNQLRFAEFDVEKGPGRELMRIDAEGTPGFIDWDLSPDGSRVALPLEGSQSILRILNLDTNEVTNKEIRPGCNPQFASWRADGQAVFVTAMCSGENQYKLFLSELEGSTHLLLESPNEWMGNPVVSPDGRRLAFAIRSQTVDVWLLEGF
jgi:serine/threonine protein kinase